MTSIVDRLGLPHAGFLAFDTDGTEYFVVVAKATFRLRHRVAPILAEEQNPTIERASRTAAIPAAPRRAWSSARVAGKRVAERSRSR
jgi:hypothetical protein